jgi:elongation of very long chain fatty acids protein 6
MEDFNWERDAIGFYERFHYVFLSCAVLYYPTIFGIRHYLQDKEPFDFGGAPVTIRDAGGKPIKDARNKIQRQPSKALFNYIFWWELGLAIFSILGAYNVVPLAYKSYVENDSFVEAVCKQGLESSDARYWWIFVFNVSKVFEFGDTLFVVLRKKPLILLQHYHHLATMLYCWWGTLVVASLNNTNPFFAAMNLCVHSVMYSWYAATRTGWRSPKWMMMCVTLIQLVQMIAGCYIVMMAQQDHDNCVWKKEDPLGSMAASFMYFSYLVLFSNLFYQNYCKKKDKKKKLA